MVENEPNRRTRQVKAIWILGRQRHQSTETTAKYELHHVYKTSFVISTEEVNVQRPMKVTTRKRNI